MQRKREEVTTVAVYGTWVAAVAIGVVVGLILHPVIGVLGGILAFGGIHSFAMEHGWYLKPPPEAKLGEPSKYVICSIALVVFFIGFGFWNMYAGLALGFLVLVVGERLGEFYLFLRKR